MRRGTMERAERSTMPAARKHCEYDGCLRPDSSKQFYLIHEGTLAGGQDWTSLIGKIFCRCCYDRFRKRGTMERASSSIFRQDYHVSSTHRTIPPSLVRRRHSRAPLSPPPAAAAAVDGGDSCTSERSRKRRRLPCVDRCASQAVVEERVLLSGERVKALFEGKWYEATVLFSTSRATRVKYAVDATYEDIRDRHRIKFKDPTSRQATSTFASSSSTDQASCWL